jgi:hypothetical protein
VGDHADPGAVPEGADAGPFERVDDGVPATGQRVGHAEAHDVGPGRRRVERDRRVVGVAHVWELGERVAQLARQLVRPGDRLERPRQPVVVEHV